MNELVIHRGTHIDCNCTGKGSRLEFLLLRATETPNLLWDQGSIMTSVVTGLRKRGADVADQIKRALDLLAQNMDQDPYRLLFPNQDPKIQQSG